MKEHSLESEESVNLRRFLVVRPVVELSSDACAVGMLHETCEQVYGRSESVAENSSQFTTQDVVRVQGGQSLPEVALSVQALRWRASGPRSSAQI